MRTAPSVLLLIASACQASQPAAPPVSDAQESVDRLALELVDLASRRVDLSTIRAQILPFQRAAPAPEPGGANQVVQSARVDLVGVELQREFELALANRLHLVEHDDPPWDAAVPAANPPVAAPSDVLRSVTHALLGDYAVRDGRLVLSVRLVELESRFVLSAAREALPLTWFSPEARAQLLPFAPAKQGQVVVAHSFATPSATSTSITRASSVEARVMTPKPHEPAPTQAPLPRSPAAHEAVSPAPSQAEDFKTWRARKQKLDLPAPQATPAEPAGPDEKPPSGPETGSKPTGPAQAVRKDPPLSEPVQAFPWRESGWLARLLGVPPSRERR